MNMTAVLVACFIICAALIALISVGIAMPVVDDIRVWFRRRENDAKIQKRGAAR